MKGSPRRRVLLTRLCVIAAAIALLAVAIQNYDAPIRWERSWAWRDRFLEGVALTAGISVGALVIGLLIGTLGGLARVSRSTVAQQVAFVYVELFRGTPFLVQLYIGYWCFARLVRLDRVVTDEALAVGVIGLGLFAGAYITEIVRAGVESIGRGQWEAARSLGLSHGRALTRVVLPQAVRRMLPPLTGEAVSLIKESSLLSTISVAEVTFHARNMQAAEYETFGAFLPLAALYLCLTLPLAALSRWMERRLAGREPLPVSRL